MGLCQRTFEDGECGSRYEILQQLIEPVLARQPVRSELIENTAKTFAQTHSDEPDL